MVSVKVQNVPHWNFSLLQPGLLCFTNTSCYTMSYLSFFFRLDKKGHETLLYSDYTAHDYCKKWLFSQFKTSQKILCVKVTVRNLKLISYAWSLLRLKMYNIKIRHCCSQAICVSQTRLVIFMKCHLCRFFRLD